jgi:hypothetical protein
MLAHVSFGTANLVSAVLVGLGVFVGLPTRYWVIDVPAVVVIVLLGAAGGGLLARSAWGAPVARLASIVTLVLGLLLVGTLAVRPVIARSTDRWGEGGAHADVGGGAGAAYLVSCGGAARVLGPPSRAAERTGSLGARVRKVLCVARR